MGSIIAVNIWRGTPFFAISLLASLQTIPRICMRPPPSTAQLPWQRFNGDTAAYHAGPDRGDPVLDHLDVRRLPLVYVLTRGGPTNSTHLAGDVAYNRHAAARAWHGAAISLWMFPFMAALVVAVLWYQRREAIQ